MRHAQQPEAVMLPTPQPGADELHPSQPGAASYPKCEAAELSSSQLRDAIDAELISIGFESHNSSAVMSLRAQPARFEALHPSDEALNSLGHNLEPPSFFLPNPLQPIYFTAWRYRAPSVQA